ncbi:MAG: hypothetical protein LPK88_08405 [Alphaproteobacteria bacterium]|nr:hypothetical protein [Alphaproteobacteria bacterium]MDX5416322.1 hypothetical protein [Alphaproteobacteria bacterium]MDX5493667.1 hypothetical protein [Alphaproteobacteria bacterium]
MTVRGRISTGVHFRTFAFGAALLIAPCAAHAEEPGGEAPAPSGEIQYELSDPVGSPPVNYRSGYDEEFDTPEQHDAEMYAEEYERRKQEEQIKAREQLDRINNFSSGAVTTDGVMGGR